MFLLIFHRSVRPIDDSRILNCSSDSGCRIVMVLVLEMRHLTRVTSSKWACKVSCWNQHSTKSLALCSHSCSAFVSAADIGSACSFGVRHPYDGRRWIFENP